MRLKILWIWNKGGKEFSKLFYQCAYTIHSFANILFLKLCSHLMKILAVIASLHLCVAKSDQIDQSDAGGCLTHKSAFCRHVAPNAISAFKDALNTKPRF